MNPNSAKPYLPFGCICQKINRQLKACTQQQSKKMRVLRHLQRRKAVSLQQISHFSRSPTSWNGTTLPSMLSALGFLWDCFGTCDRFCVPTWGAQKQSRNTGRLRVGLWKETLLLVSLAWQPDGQHYWSRLTSLD